MINRNPQSEVLNVYSSVRKLIEANPVGLGSYTPDRERDYHRALETSHLQTIQDIVDISRDRKERVLEIGSHFGVVSMCLARLGFSVVAQDMEWVQQNSELQKHYLSEGVMVEVADLRESQPHQDESFDVVICCEVFEHLNFNPLPALIDIRRILTQGGQLYVALPNQAWLPKRLNLLRGKSIHDSVSAYENSIKDLSISGMHWREYTLDEVVEVLEMAGLRSTETAYRFYRNRESSLHPRQLLLNAIYQAVPSLRPNLVCVAEK